VKKLFVMVLVFCLGMCAFACSSPNEGVGEEQAALCTQAPHPSGGLGNGSSGDYSFTSLTGNGNDSFTVTATGGFSGTVTFGTSDLVCTGSWTGSGITAVAVIKKYDTNGNPRGAYIKINNASVAQVDCTGDIGTYFTDSSASGGAGFSIRRIFGTTTRAGGHYLDFYGYVTPNTGVAAAESTVHNACG
jgi:hypothetical protein